MRMAGIGRRECLALNIVGARARHIDTWLSESPEKLRRLLLALPGIEAWTVDSSLAFVLSNGEPLPVGSVVVPAYARREVTHGQPESKKQSRIRPSGETPFQIRREVMSLVRSPSRIRRREDLTMAPCVPLPVQMHS